MSRNTKGTRGYSTPRAQRKSRPREFTLTEKANAILDAMEPRTRSAWVSAIIEQDGAARAVRFEEEES